MGDVHEIFFPGGSMGMSLFFIFLFQGYAIKRNELSNAKVQMSNQFQKSNVKKVLNFGL